MDDVESDTSHDDEEAKRAADLINNLIKTPL